MIEGVWESLITRKVCSKITQIQEQGKEQLMNYYPNFIDFAVSIFVVVKVRLEKPYFYDLSGLSIISHLMIQTAMRRTRETYREKCLYAHL